ncbi:MAG: hypothetical protein V3V96_06585 [Acidiferrobacterales bacterium]
MPLKDRDRDRPRRLNRLGIIRLGFKKTNAKGVEFPVQAGHFVLTDAEEIAAHYGDEPRELDVMLPFADIQRNFDAAYTVWAGGVLVCRGDGEFVEYAQPHKVTTKKKEGRTWTSVKNAPGDTLVSRGMASGTFTWGNSTFNDGDHVPCPGQAADLYPHCRSCKVSAILKVMMSDPELFRFGYYQLGTGSGKNYDTILGTLELMFEGVGRLSGIPFVLRLVEEATNYKDASGQSRKGKSWFLQLESDPEYTRKMLTMRADAALNVDQQVARLSPGDYEEVGDYEETAPPPIADVELLVDEKTGEIRGANEVDADAVVVTPVPETEPEEKAPAAAKTNGKMPRPLTPIQLRGALLQRAGYTVEDNVIVSEPQNDPMAKEVAKGFLGKVIGTLNEVFASQEDPDSFRHTVLKYVFGYDSANELHLGETSSLRSWLLGDNEELDSLAVQEAWAVIRDVSREAGQLDLLPDEQRTMAEFEGITADREKAKAIEATEEPEETPETEVLDY